MEFKNIFKTLKNRLHASKKPQYTELQTKYLAHKKARKHLQELQDENSKHPTKELELEIQQYDKKFVEINMEYIKFYEDARNNALMVLQKELDDVTTND